MPRILPLNRKNDGSEIEVAFTQHETIYNSRITNMKATLGHSPVAFKAYMQWYPMYHEVKSILGDRLATLFAWSVSEASDCPLCSTYFRKEIIESGEVPEHLVVSEKDQHLLTFGAEIAKNKGFVSDEIFQNVREQYSDEHIVSLIAFAGIMIATNIFNNAIHTEIDEYLAPYRSEKQQTL